MEEYPEMRENERDGLPPSTEQKRWLIDFFIVLVIALLASAYCYRQHLKARQLAAQESVANATIDDLQRQLNNLTEGLGNIAAAQQAAANAGARSEKKQTAKTAAADKHYAQLQTQLTDQQRQLRQTQDLIAKNQRHLEVSLSSTRDELNGSIAKTHEELVALAKRGERSYFEFDLAKSKKFQRIGPLPLSLRKTDTKHSSFDMAMVVDDYQLMKEKANLYEPIWIHTENQSQPMQVVVNRITKDFVHGYVSAPKYRPSELTTAGTTSVSSVATPRNTGSESTNPE